MNKRYGAGDAKIGSIVGKGPKVGKQLRQKFLNATPALKRLSQDVARAVQARKHLVGLDGRILHVRSSHAALNTLLQSAGAVLMKKAATLVEDCAVRAGLFYGRDYFFVANVHDEIQSEVMENAARPDEFGKAVVHSVVEAGKYFNFRCPLDGEYKVGKNWAETH